MEVLKDAASSAIYGTQGANGVIIITTKQGRSVVSYSTPYVNQSVRSNEIDECSQFVTYFQKQVKHKL
jgi:TonB-dependent SusC/RagA subfamily outer membrane receptor